MYSSCNSQVDAHVEPVRAAGRTMYLYSMLLAEWCHLRHVSSCAGLADDWQLTMYHPLPNSALKTALPASNELPGPWEFPDILQQHTWLVMAEHASGSSSRGGSDNIGSG